MAMMTMTMIREAGRRSRSVTRSNGHECGQSGYPSICTSLIQGERGRVVGVRGKGRRLILSFLCSSHFLPLSNIGDERGFHSGITNKRAGERKGGASQSAHLDHWADRGSVDGDGVRSWTDSVNEERARETPLGPFVVVVVVSE